MTVLDARGAEIRPGDVVVYVSGGRFGARVVGRVAEVRKQIRVDALDHLGNSVPRQLWADERVWLEPRCAFVVTGLPPVAGRLNTEETP